MDLILIRHPEVAVLPGTCYGRSDVPLRDDPQASTRILIDKLSALAVSPTAIHSSPLQRCSSVARALGVDLSRDVWIDGRLAEMDFGAWEMQRWDDVSREQLDEWAADVEKARPHGGENAVMVAKRVGDWLAAVSAARSDGDSAGNSARDVARDETTVRAGDHGDKPHDRSPARQSCRVVMSHAGVIRLATALVLGLPILTCLQWPLEMSGVCWLSHSGGEHGRWSLRKWNV